MACDLVLILMLHPLNMKPFWLVEIRHSMTIGSCLLETGIYEFSRS